MFHVLLGCCEFSTVYWELVNWNTTEYKVNHFSATITCLDLTETQNTFLARSAFFSRPTN